MTYAMHTTTLGLTSTRLYAAQDKRNPMARASKALALEVLEHAVINANATNEEDGYVIGWEFAKTGNFSGGWFRCVSASAEMIADGLNMVRGGHAKLMALVEAMLADIKALVVNVVEPVAVAPVRKPGSVGVSARTIVIVTLHEAADYDDAVHAVLSGAKLTEAIAAYRCQGFGAAWNEMRAATAQLLAEGRIERVDTEFGGVSERFRFARAPAQARSRLAARA